MPQAVAPLLGSFIVAAVGVVTGVEKDGFTGLFIASAVFAALGGLTVVRVRSVK